ncbi:MAG: hypothetical protein K6E20_05260 [Acholeplasmatales bacterium]|nr:hypothetical protein [Acholeplasmatales bacterium]
MKKKRILLGITLALASMIALGSCDNSSKEKSEEQSSIIESSSEAGGMEDLNYTDIQLDNMSCGGVISDMTDFSQYINTEMHVKVSTAKDFLDALSGARQEYTTTVTETSGEASYIVRNNVRKNEANWTSAITKGLYLYDAETDTYTKIPSDVPYDKEDTVYTADLTYYEDSPYTGVKFTQELTKEATVNVIEITEDLDLGYNLIKDLGCNTSVFENWDSKNKMSDSTDVYCDPDIKAAGISKINISQTSNLLIFSKNGSKIKHAGFGVTSCKNVAFRNLNMDEIWMWEDSTSKTPTFTVGDYDLFGWAYFKISFSENIWIDHCTFGKSFDGQIDYSNPCYSTVGTYSKAPYGASGSNGLHISYCNFTGGSTDKDGYLYKMMARMEEEYLKYEEDPIGYEFTSSTPGYYIALRAHDFSFDEILNGLAVPQKKAFLWNDSGDPYVYNKYMQVSMTSCKLKNIEDRLPKVRGGMAYVYNTSVDNKDYLPYSTKFKGVNLGNAKYKSAGVSQGILAGLDASIYLESVVYEGISSMLKNNDSESDKYPTVNGGYMIKNSRLGTIYGSITEDDDPFSSLNVSSAKLSPNYFAFKVNGEKVESKTLPINISCYNFEDTLNQDLTDYFETAQPGINSLHSEYYWSTVKYNK